MPSKLTSSSSFQTANFVWHDMPWCIFTKRHLHAPLQARATGSSRLLPRSQAPATVENVGPTILELFVGLHRDFEAISALQPRIEHLKRRLRGGQSYYDSINSTILQHANVPELDMEPHVARHEAALANMEREIADLKHDLREDENSMANLEVQKRTAWQKVFDNGRAYFDSCFEVGFEAEWALGEKHCRWLRQMIDQEVLIAHNEAKILKLKQELGNVKSSKRIAKKKTAVDSSRLNSVLLRALDETRHQQLDAEMDRVQLRIASQEETLQLRKDYHRYDQDRFCGGVIRPLLEKVGKLQTGSTRSPNSSGPSLQDVSNRHRDEIQSSREKESTKDGPKTRRGATDVSGSTESEVDGEKLQDRYLQLREQLGDAQEDHHDKRLRLENDELDHLLTFRNSNHDWYEAYMDQQLEADVHAIQVIEGDLAELRERLIRHGVNVPRSRRESLRTVREGGIRKTTSNSVSPQSRSRSPRPKRRKRDVVNGKMNDWRLKTGEAPRRSEITPSSGKSLAKTRSGVSSSRRGETASPDDEKERFLDGFRKKNKRQQEQARGKYGPLGVESEPEAE